MKNSAKARENVRVLVITNSGVYSESENDRVVEIYSCSRASCSKCVFKRVCGYLN